MSNFKNGRMPKSRYDKLVENGCIKEKSSHKKHSTFVSRFHHGLRCSRDADGNVLCAGCKTLLVPKNVTDTVFGEYVTKIYKMGGCHNCCYDCEFSSFCNKCSLNWVTRSGSYVATCPFSFLEQVKNNSYNGGRHSRFTDTESACFKEVFKDDIKYNNSLCGMFIDSEFLLELYEKERNNSKFTLYKRVIKSLLSNLPAFDPELEQEDYKEFYLTKESVRKAFYSECNKNNKSPECSKRPEMNGPNIDTLKAAFLQSCLCKKNI